MKIKSAKLFREWYKTDVKHNADSDLSVYNADFVGCTHNLSDGRQAKGLFEMFHGDKEDVGNYLSSIFDIAEDGQAIYEFVQNAADCRSTLFYMFYTDEYFLAVNNGDAFERNILKSLLNVAQSTKKDSSQIGRFGIGFKLVHRLVGKGNGKDEIVNGYKGPVLFSWSKFEDIAAFARQDGYETCDSFSDDDGLPTLVKLILTNFPAGPGETAKDLSYNDRILFPDEEYREMSHYVGDCLRTHIDSHPDDFRHGSLFFIKLGERKSELLERNRKEAFEAGVEYSLNTISNLTDVRINGNEIRKTPLIVENGRVEKGSKKFIEISPEYKDSDIEFSIGYNEIDFSVDLPFEQVNKLKAAPSFYKFFPLADEKHGSALFIHCAQFNNEANRRKLLMDTVNKGLFAEIAEKAIALCDQYRVTDRPKFLQLYANILLTDEPHDKWISESLYGPLLEYVKRVIPMKSCRGRQLLKDKMYIRKVKSAVADNESVCGDIHWFEWDGDNVADLAEAAREKIGLKECRMGTFIRECDKTKLEEWCARNVGTPQYGEFLSEINDECGGWTSQPESWIALRSLKIFKFSDGVMRSFNDVVVPGQRTAKGAFLFRNNKISHVRSILESLGIATSDIDSSNFTKIFENRLPIKDSVFTLIRNQIATGRSLTRAERSELFDWLCDKGNNGLGIEDVKIFKLPMCRNSRGELMAFENMLKYDASREGYLLPYQIIEQDYTPSMNRFLIDDDKIYQKIIFPKWGELIENEIGDASQFYESVRKYYRNDKSNIAGISGSSGKKYILTFDCGFAENGARVFYNASLQGNGRAAYVKIGNVMSTCFGKHIPAQEILPYLTEAPFYTTNVGLISLSPTDATVPAEDVEQMIKLCDAIRESFFQTFIVVDDGEGLCHIKAKDEAEEQVYARDAMAKFISQHCASYFFNLPSSLSQYGERLLRGADLEKHVVERLNQDLLIEQVKDDFVKFAGIEARREIIKRTVSILLDLDKEFEADGYEHKIIAAAVGLDTKADKESFRRKVAIKKDGQEHMLSQIPKGGAISIPFGLKPFNVSDLLPTENGSTALLTELVDRLEALGMERVDLAHLFGIEDSTDTESILDTLRESYPVLCNAQQLAFILLKEAQCSFSIKTLGEERSLANGPFYACSNLAFIKPNYRLADQYSGVEEYCKLPCATVMKEPTVVNCEFSCAGLPESLTEEERISLLDHLDKLRSKEKYALYSVDFSVIDGKNAVDLLGFNPAIAILDAAYATNEEKIAPYALRWASTDEKLKTLTDVVGGRLRSDNTVALRKFLTGETADFDKDLVGTIGDSGLRRTLQWIGSKTDYRLPNSKAYVVLKAVVKAIGSNDFCSILDHIDEERLMRESHEMDISGYSKWKEQNSIEIFIHEGSMPHTVSLSNFADGVIFEYSEGSFWTIGDGKIYISDKENGQTTLQIVASRRDNTTRLTTELVLELFNASFREENEKLKKENDDLRARLAKYEQPDSPKPSQAAPSPQNTQTQQIASSPHTRVTSEKEPAPACNKKEHSATEPTSASGKSRSAPTPEERSHAEPLDNFDVSEVKVPGVNLGVRSGDDISEEQQKEYSRLAKLRIKAELERRGFDVSKAEGEYSVLSGITRDGTEYPTVAKSHRSINTPLKINPEEWATLFKERSMLWIDDGSAVYPIKMRDFFDYNDKITLTFSTENLVKDERVHAIMDILHYLKNVHLDIAGIRRTFNNEQFLSDLLFDGNRPENSDLAAGSDGDVD